MSKITTVYVVRHGESEFNASKHIESFKHEGELGSPLTPRGKEQAKKLAKKLSHIDFAAILSSDMNRTRETAEIIAKEESLKVATSDSIRERSIHSYLLNTKSLSAKGLDRLNEEMLKDLQKLDEKSKMKYKHSEMMESSEEGAYRLLQFILAAVEKYNGKTILVVCHGNIMRCLLTHLGWAKFNELVVGAIENTGYFVLETKGDKFEVKETWGISKQKNQLRYF